MISGKKNHQQRKIIGNEIPVMVAGIWPLRRIPASFAGIQRCWQDSSASRPALPESSRQHSSQFDRTWIVRI
jgi:hypothetical protein